MAHHSIISEEDFIRAYDTYSDGLFRHCHLRIADRERSKHLMSQAFKNLWSFIADGNHVDSIKVFLYRELNQLIDESKREAMLPPQETIIDILGKTLATLHLLPRDHRRLCILRHVDELSFEDIGKVVGGTVERNLGLMREIDKTFASLLPKHA